MISHLQAKIPPSDELLLAQFVVTIVLQLQDGLVCRKISRKLPDKALSVKIMSILISKQHKHASNIGNVC